MKEPIAFDDAVDLLDADHQAVKKLFIDYDALCEDDAPAERKQALAGRICQALTVHAQLEEELFYPAVRKALGDDALMDHAQQEHAQAKELIARIQRMKPADAARDASVKALAKLIDAHVLQEREQMFLEARRAQMDLRGLAPKLAQRQQQLKKQATSATSAATAKEAA